MATNLVQKSCFQCGVGVMRKTGVSKVKVSVNRSCGISEVEKPIVTFVCSRCRKKSWLFL